MADVAPSNSADGALNHFGRSCLETWSGRCVDLDGPNPALLDRRDICTALGNTCRYGGHVRRFYSVAEHSVFVSRLLEHRGAGPRMIHAGLLHDAAEAYCGDLIGPLKWLLTRDHGGMSSAEYTLISQRFDRAIAERYWLEPWMFDAPEVKLADLWALRIEAAELTVSGGVGWRWTEEVSALGGRPPGVEWAGGLPPERAADLMDRRWQEISRLEVAAA